MKNTQEVKNEKEPKDENLEQSIENNESADTRVNKTKDFEIVLPHETKMLADYIDPITEEYIIETNNTIRERTLTENFWNKKDKNIHIWM